MKHKLPTDTIRVKVTICFGGGAMCCIERRPSPKAKYRPVIHSYMSARDVENLRIRIGPSPSKPLTTATMRALRRKTECIFKENDRFFRDFEGIS